MSSTRLVAVLAVLVVPSLAAAGPTQKKGPRNVAIVAYQGAEILDFAGPAEVFAAAGDNVFNVYTVGRTTEPVTMQGFIRVTPQYSVESAPKPDIVVIPGGASDTLTSDAGWMTWLTSVTAGAEVTLTVCTGAFALAKTGALDGLEVTTFYGAIEHLREVAPKAKVTDGRRFIDNGRTVTTAGVSAGIDGALHVVARIAGRRIADSTARYMEYHWTPEPYLAKRYVYWNPSADERGRALQQAQAAAEERRLPEALAAFRALTRDDTDGAAWLALGDVLVQTQDYSGAADAYAKVPSTATPKQRSTGLYNAGCAKARAGQPKAALALVAQALELGFPRQFALADSDLAALRADIEKLPAKP